MADAVTVDTGTVSTATVVTGTAVVSIFSSDVLNFTLVWAWDTRASIRIRASILDTRALARDLRVVLAALVRLVASRSRSRSRMSPGGFFRYHLPVS